MLAVPARVEDADDRLRDGEHLALGDELEELAAARAHERGAAARRDAKAASAVARARVEAEIVHERVRVVRPAAGERDLELARERARERMPQEVACERARVGRRVEHLVRRDARRGARRHVAHRVAARLARGHSRGGELAHRVRHLLERHEVELEVLARRDVAEPARVPLGDVGDHLELARRQDALRDLRAQHGHAAVLALAVRAAKQPERAPRVGVDLAPLEATEHVDELVDVGGLREVERRASARL